MLRYPLRQCLAIRKTYRYHAALSSALPSALSAVSAIPGSAFIANIRSASWLAVSSVILGVPAALWFYKCTMMVIFQRRIIYMPYIGRSEPLPASTPGLACNVCRVESAEGVSIACLRVKRAKTDETKNALFYMQGNAATPVHRLPLFSKLLLPSGSVDLIFAAAPRSYWTSTHPLFQGPSENNLVTDYHAAFRHLRNTHPTARIYLHAHSIGCGVLLQLLLQHPEIMCDIEGIILEAPMTSLADMLSVMYENRFLPYRYLSPFLFDRYDSVQALSKLGEREEMKQLRVLIVALEKDELVPREMTKRFFEYAKASGLDVQEVQITGALHDTGFLQASWMKAIRAFVR